MSDGEDLTVEEGDRDQEGLGGPGEARRRQEVETSPGPSAVHTASQAAVPRPRTLGEIESRVKEVCPDLSILPCAWLINVIVAV